jgi:Glucose-6-phosphate dehydrogenase, NAD binding domain/Glucose-6-phosphate dehydrogenase, C-terminal domain
LPPNAALSAVRLLAEAGLVDRSRIIMEKPFGTDLKSAVSLNAKLHEVFSEDQIFWIDHFLGKEPAQNILAFRFANGLFEPIWNRNFIDHVQIDVPETLGLGKRAGFYEATGVTCSRYSHSWQRSRRRPWRRGPSVRKRIRSFAACCRSTRRTSSAGNTRDICPRPAWTWTPIPKPSSR